jgi:ribosome biogenesis GTPase / thiamine phosphate phosphatase
LSQQSSGGALATLGWSDRVAALYSEFAEPHDQPGRVVRVERGQSVVVGDDGLEVLSTSPLSSPSAVGDWVVLRDGAITITLPRWSELTRQDPDGSGLQTLASNIDLVLIAAPADRLNPTRVERELAVAWDSGARPIVVMTKADLAVPEAYEDLLERLAGVEVIATSADTGVGIEQIAASLRPDLSGVLLGPSGAGKSSLVNAVIGAEVLAVGEVRDIDRRGRHTTARRQLLSVPGGGVLIDTPGLRSLGLAGDGGLQSVFPDIEALSAQCRFSDCRHEVEPDCAVMTAIRTGALDRNRLESFRKLHREVAARELSQDPVERKEKLRIYKLRTKAARNHAKRRGR